MSAIAPVGRGALAPGRGTLLERALRVAPGLILGAAGLAAAAAAQRRLRRPPPRRATQPQPPPPAATVWKLSYVEIVRVSRER